MKKYTCTTCLILSDRNFLSHSSLVKWRPSRHVISDTFCHACFCVVRLDEKIPECSIFREIKHITASLLHLFTTTFTLLCQGTLLNKQWWDLNPQVSIRLLVDAHSKADIHLYQVVHAIYYIQETCNTDNKGRVGTEYLKCRVSWDGSSNI